MCWCVYVLETKRNVKRPDEVAPEAIAAEARILVPPKHASPLALALASNLIPSSPEVVSELVTMPPDVVTRRRLSSLMLDLEPVEEPLGPHGSATSDRLRMATAGYKHSALTRRAPSTVHC